MSSASGERGAVEPLWNGAVEPPRAAQELHGHALLDCGSLAGNGALLVEGDETLLVEGGSGSQQAAKRTAARAAAAGAAGAAGSSEVATAPLSAMPAMPATGSFG